MMCPNCGAQVTDGGKFCDKCGGILVNVTNVSRPISQPVYQQAQQYQQPQVQPQPQPAYAGAYDPTSGGKLKGSLVLLRIISVAVVIAWIALVVFIVSGGGARGKLKHVWLADGSITYNFKTNSITISDIPLSSFKWKVKGKDRLVLELPVNGTYEKGEFTFLLRDNGRTLVLKDVDFPEITQIMVRID